MNNGLFDNMEDKYVELIQQSEFFDPEWYVEQYPDVGLSSFDPARHYLKYGTLLLRNPSSLFSAKGYVERNEDVVKRGVNPLLHYLLYGQKEGRQVESVKASRFSPECGNVIIYKNKAIADLIKKARSRKSDKCIDATIARNGSFNGRDILARYATSALLSFEDVCNVLENESEEPFSEDINGFIAHSDPYLLIRLARLIATQRLSEMDAFFSLKIVKVLIDNRKESCFSRADGKFFAQLAVHEKDFLLAEFFMQHLKVNKSDRNQLQLETSAQRCHNLNWLEDFNHFWFPGLEGVQAKVDDSSKSKALFDLISASPSEIVEGELVTVIMSSWNPDEDQIKTSVKSILNQSWRNIELIIVDDCSTNNPEPIYQKIKSWDSRVKIVYSELNKGTYNSRNIALNVANGVFVTFQDVDDWSHPRKIEKQVTFLLNNPEKIASKSYALRCYDNLSTALPGSPSLQPNASSLLFYREKVVSEIGYFDAVRKGGDTEFILRIQAFFGKESLGYVLKQPLSLVRLSHGSLSRSEFKPGWRHRARSVYKESYQYWHQKAIDEGHKLYVPVEGNSDNVFCPLRFRQKKENAIYDVVLIGDWRQYGGPQKSMIEEIKALKKYGKKVAICQMEAFRFLSTEQKSKNKEIQALINRGVVDEVCLDDEIEVKVVLLRYPLLLQFTPYIKCNWLIGEGRIIANQAPHELNGDDFRYYVSECSENAKSIFGKYFSWSPMGPQVEYAIKHKVPPMLLANNIPGILDIEEWFLAKDSFVADKPVIGRYSRDNVLKFPSTREKFLSAYPSEGCYVKIMGGINSCHKIIGSSLPTNWSVIPYGARDVKDFLKEIDFFVYFDNPNIVEAFGRSILEAIASGVLVILHPKFKDAFGDAALYCDEENVSETIREYSSWDVYQTRMNVVQNILVNNFSYESFLKNLSLGVVNE